MAAVFERRCRIEAPAEEVYRWHARPGAFERLSPPWDPPRVESRADGIEDEGARVVLRLGPLGLRWVAEHHDAIPGREFRDRQVQGPFAAWEHLHRMEPQEDGVSQLLDRVEYALPLGAIGERLGGGFVHRQLAALFAFRHRVTAADLATHAGCRRGIPMRFAVTGSSGLVGQALVPFLTTGGHEVLRLVRRPTRDPGEVHWDPSSGALDHGAIDGVDAVVHLAGANIAAGRWSPARKAALRESRIGPTRLLAQTLAGLPRPPRVLVSASAIGIYGHRGDAWLDESSPPAADFLGALASDWEQAATSAADAGIRVVSLRTGIVLTPSGGALGRMLPAFRAGLGGRLGSGRQWTSWIALDDLICAIHFLATTPGLAGPFNAVAPSPVTNDTLTRTLAAVLGRPAVLPVPAAALRLLFGEMADAALLSSTRVKPARLTEAGYAFRFPDLEGALRHLLGRDLS